MSWNSRRKQVATNVKKMIHHKLDENGLPNNDEICKETFTVIWKLTSIFPATLCLPRHFIFTSSYNKLFPLFYPESRCICIIFPVANARKNLCLNVDSFNFILHFEKRCRFRAMLFCHEIRTCNFLLLLYLIDTKLLFFKWVQFSTRLKQGLWWHAVLLQLY